MRRFFVAWCWVPVALWAVTLWSIRGYDGWGAWAAAPLLVPSVLLSVGWAVAGLLMIGADAIRRRHVDLQVVCATAVGGLVIGYYVLANLLR